MRISPRPTVPRSKNVLAKSTVAIGATSCVPSYRTTGFRNSTVCGAVIIVRTYVSSLRNV
jgi:hypothetical protein